MRTIFIIAVVTCCGFSAYAKTTLNSMCYVLDRPGSKLEGEHAEELFEIASVSKVVTAYWALKVLGPSYNFKTRVHIARISPELYDVHIQGGKDPFWGRQLTHFLFAELNRNKVTRIRNLTFDENLTFRWAVVTDHIDPSHPSGNDIMNSLRNHVTNLRSEYPRTRREAASVGITLPKGLSLRVQNIEPLASSAFQVSSNTQTYVLRSAPLFRYLKEMNAVSNNHVADRLFDFLGRADNFRAFIQQDMNMDAGDIQFINGSGNVVIGKDQNGISIKEYNKASCSTMVQILIKMDSDLKNYKMGLKDVMAVSRTDASTLSPRFDSIPNTLVGKTGTIDPAITLAGVISTAQGDVYFGVFMDTEGPADWGAAKDKVRLKVFELMKRFGGRKTFSYATREFMPFDERSKLTRETLSAVSLP